MVLVTDNADNARALTMQRIILMLYLLKTDFKFIVEGSSNIIENIKKLEGKHSQRYVKAKEYFDTHSQGFSQINALIFKMEKLIGNKEGIDIIKKDMNSERIADLHCFFDIIMEVENISVLNDIIRTGLSENLQN